MYALYIILIKKLVKKICPGYHVARNGKKGTRNATGATMNTEGESVDN